MRSIVYSRDAERTLRRMPANTALLIVAKIDQYGRDPASLANNSTALKGMPGHIRLRVGDWRVIMRDDGVVIAIIRIAPRGSVYE